MKITKITLFVILLIVVIMMLPIKTRISFFLDDSHVSSINFEKNIIINNEKKLKDQYQKLVKNINNSEFDLRNLVFISEDLDKGNKGNALKGIRKSFAWIDEESLYYIIEEKNFSAFLLSKKNKKHYVLFFDNNQNKFYFDYQKEVYFQPLIVGWVNNLYSGGIEVLDKGIASVIFDNENTCFFSKGGVSIYGDQLMNSSSAKECMYGPYNIVEKNGKNTVKWGKEPPYVELMNSLDATMQFLKWISN